MFYGFWISIMMDSLLTFYLNAKRENIKFSKNRFKRLFENSG